MGDPFMTPLPLSPLRVSESTLSTPLPPDSESLSEGQNQRGSSLQGVRIIGFRPDSIAEKAGMRRSDVIIEYDGEGNLTTDILLTLTTMTRPDESRIRVVFLRDGDVFSMALPPGSLGISVMDIAVRNPLRDPKVDFEIRTKASVEKIVKFMRSELAEGTGKGTLRRTLVLNGWDEDEAILFIEQIAAEVAKDEKRGRATPGWYEELIQWMGLILTCYWTLFICPFWGRIDAVIWAPINTLVTGAVMIWSLREWLKYRKRLKRLKLEEKQTENQALLFKPTKGNLHITERCRTRQELVGDILVGLRIFVLLLMVATLVFLLIYGLIFH